MRSIANEEWKASVERQKFGVWKVQSVENEKKITFPIRHSPLSIRHSPFAIPHFSDFHAKCGKRMCVI